MDKCIGYQKLKEFGSSWHIGKLNIIFLICHKISTHHWQQSKNLWKSDTISNKKKFRWYIIEIITPKRLSYCEPWYIMWSNLGVQGKVSRANRHQCSVINKTASMWHLSGFSTSTIIVLTLCAAMIRFWCSTQAMWNNLWTLFMKTLHERLCSNKCSLDWKSIG